MTKLYRAAGAVFMLSAVALTVTGCMGPTYGTGKPANEQLIDDLTDSFSLRPAKPVQVAYQPRGKLVQPANEKVLVAPEQSLASKDNPAWVESPEDMRNRLKAEADANANNSSYRSPLAISVTEGKTMSPEQQRLAFREARKIQTGSYSDQRRFMSDPPLEYRKVDDPAKLTDLGTPEAQKAKDRKEQAAIAGSGKKWWQVFD
jgi:predicted component of type VI protein secretion system